MPNAIIDQPVELQDQNGDIFTLSPGPWGKHHDALSAMSRYFCVLDILDPNGTKCGVINYYLEEKEPGTVYLNWVDLSATARGKGYVIAMAEYANAYFAQEGIKRLVLVVEKEAQATYESFGFTLDTTEESHYGRIQMERIFD